MCLKPTTSSKILYLPGGSYRLVVPHSWPLTFGSSPTPLGLGPYAGTPNAFLPPPPLAWPGLALSLTPQQPTTLPSAAATRHFRLKPNGELLYLNDCNGWAGVKVQASSMSFPIDSQAAMSGAARCLLVIHMCPPPTSNGGWRDSPAVEIQHYTPAHSC